jgi:hypothetical protein
LIKSISDCWLDPLWKVSTGDTSKVLDRNLDVPEKAAMLGTSEGTPAEGGGKRSFTQLGQRGQMRGQCQGRGLESRFGGGCSLRIVGANVQAVVAAKDSVTQLGSQFLGDFILWPMKLDGQIGDALVGVHYIRLCDCTGWAGLEAQHAGPAEIGAWFIWLQVDRGEDLSQEQPGAVSGRDQV